MVQSKIKLICIVGPTAVGKSKLAIELARKINAEIISADSQLVYKGFDIGTAKPSIAERRSINHHLIDIVNPDEQFNLAKFEDLATEAINKIRSKEKNIIVVGGTGLYLKSLLYGLDERPESSETIRKKLQERLLTEGTDKLYEELKSIDPKIADKIHPNNHVRLLRALEIMMISNKKLSDFKQATDKRFDVLMIGLNRNRDKLYEAVNKRVDEMIKQGWEIEVQNLLKDYSSNLPAFNALGYREITNILNEKMDRITAINLIKRKSRNYAKRQLTWFKADKSVNWFDVDNQGFDKTITDKVLLFLNK